MNKYITLFFSVSIFLWSCEGGKAPGGIIAHKQMVSLLTELHEVDGRMYSLMAYQDSLNKYGTIRYEALFKRHQTDSTQFNRSLLYYAKQPAELQKIYEQVMDNLKKKTDSLNKIEHKADSVKRLKPRLKVE